MPALVTGDGLDGFASAWSRRLRDSPDARFLSTGGRNWTYSAFDEELRASATALARGGIEEGDHVAILLPSGPDMLRIQFALLHLGAIFIRIRAR